MRRLMVASVLWGAACGSVDGDRPTEADEHHGIGPRILGIAPPTIAVGERLVVFGQRFLRADEGVSALLVKGRFHGDDGEVHSFERRVVPEAEDTTGLRWHLWPDVVFHPQGNQIGRFAGQIRVVNESTDETTETSEAFAVEITVDPSLVVRALGPRGIGALGSPCDKAVIDATLGGTPLGLVVEAVGIEAGQPASPLVFEWQIETDDIDVVLDRGGDPDGPTERSTKASIVDQVKAGTLSGIQDGSACSAATNGGTGEADALLASLCHEKRRYVQKGANGIIGEGPMDRLRVHQIALDGYQEVKAYTEIRVAAEDGAGQRASLVIPLTVYREFYLDRKSESHRIVSREDPVKMYEMVSESDQYTEVRYRENVSERRKTSIGAEVDLLALLEFDPSKLVLGNHLPFDGIQLAFQTRDWYSSGCARGRDESETLPPGHCATSWRQTLRVRRSVKLLARDRCGVGFAAGEIYANEWSWAREIAISADCPAPHRTLGPPGPCEEDCTSAPYPCR